jgi:hypothetical protein
MADAKVLLDTSLRSNSITLALHSLLENVNHSQTLQDKVIYITILNKFKMFKDFICPFINNMDYIVLCFVVCSM